MNEIFSGITPLHIAAGIFLLLLPVTALIYNGFVNLRNRADGAFLNLQNRITEAEHGILQSRKYYNGVVRILNTRTETFPFNLLAKAMGFSKRPYFTAEDDERENVKIEF